MQDQNSFALGLEISLFHTSSHKRGLEHFFSMASVQMCKIEELRLSKTYLCRVLKQAGVNSCGSKGGWAWWAMSPPTFVLNFTFKFV